MSDKFKFRAWDKTHMHYFTFGDIDNGCLIIEKSENRAYERILLLSDCEITQCTGEKDENRKLIYDGDILKSTISGTVFLSNQTLSFALGFSEIIGNIFQNPELLNK